MSDGKIGPLHVPFKLTPTNLRGVFHGPAWPKGYDLPDAADDPSGVWRRIASTRWQNAPPPSHLVARPTRRRKLPGERNAGAPLGQPMPSGGRLYRIAGHVTSRSPGLPHTCTGSTQA